MPVEAAGPEGSGMTFIRPGQVDVVPMDEEDEEEEEAILDLDTSGPFSSLPDLKARLGHLRSPSPAHPPTVPRTPLGLCSVFLHYLLSNSDPASLLFYLITDLYEAGSSVKELRKWAYEIHSSFLMPTAPFRVARIEREMVGEIDDVLGDAGADDALTFRRLFVRTRQRALDDIRVCPCPPLLRLLTGCCLRNA